MTLAGEAYELQTVVNLRDLGGLPIGAGQTASGVLFRSDAPYRGDAMPNIADWPPATVVDLRDRVEGSGDAYEWPDEVEVISHPVLTGARIDRSAERPLIDVYRTVLDTAAHRVVEAIGNYSESGATVVHCAAGKDRTGIVVAVSLMVAGVDPDAIVADYQRTEDAIGDVYRRMRERRKLFADVQPDDQMLRTPRAAIDLVLETVDGAAGGARGWFENHGGDLGRLERWLDRFTAAS